MCSLAIRSELINSSGKLSVHRRRDAITLSPTECVEYAAAAREEEKDDEISDLVNPRRRVRPVYLTRIRAIHDSQFRRERR